jgi:antitoxin component YwqK of YwqJK toxin-antitoxin module
MTSFLHRLIFVWLFFVLAMPVFAQTAMVFNGDTVNVTDGSKMKQGMWMIFDATGTKIVEQGNYVNNKKEGVWIRTYPNGKTKHEITFVNGVANGPAKFYFEDGQLWEAGTWVIDHWTGSYEMYHPNGKKAYDWFYNNSGKRTGTQKYYHDNGKLKYSGNWENGKTVGNLKVYDEKGSLVAERVYEDGKFEKTVGHALGVSDKNPSQTMTQFTGTGQHTVYSLSGQIEKSGYFVNGQLQDGYQLVYDQDGVATTKLVFEKGNLVKSVPLK